MTIKTYKRSELRDTLAKRDAAAVKLGQAEAKRYLRAKEQSRPTGLIRKIIAGAIAGLAFVVLAAAILVITLAL